VIYYKFLTYLGFSGFPTSANFILIQSERHSILSFHFVTLFRKIFFHLNYR